MKTESGADTATHPEGQGQYPGSQPVGVETVPASSSWTKAEPDRLMEAVVEKANMARAYRRVVANQGAQGVDGMPVDQLADHLKQLWPTLRERLLAGEYHSSPIRAVEIPKPKGGTRQLGISTATDRLIQQALRQVLTASLSDFLESPLRLTINRDKSAVDRPWNRGYQGYTLTRHKLRS
ncbi:hypothetical protein [Halomonas sp.]|uniref:hypothetical protein n=1 Tax=Halomonas sp. TaxID=1486246 RepID=UPI0026213F03|nr:hypothetical protein [Halomonas sp.]